MKEFQQGMDATQTYAELQKSIEGRVGESGLNGIHKEPGPHSPRILRLAIGNPLVMKEMVKQVPMTPDPDGELSQFVRE